MRIAIAALTLFAVAAAEASVPAVSWDADPVASLGQAFNFKAVPPRGAAPIDFATRRPQSGNITGGMNNSSVQLHFDRVNWTITGAVNHSPVQLSIDHQNAFIAGSANHSPVQLRFAWTPNRVVLEGGANRSQVQLDVDWGNGLLQGYSNHSPVRLEFSLAGSIIRGYANRAPVELHYDPASGLLTGHMNRSSVSIRLANLELSDFLQHIYLFLN